MNFYSSQTQIMGLNSEPESRTKVLRKHLLNHIKINTAKYCIKKLNVQLSLPARSCIHHFYPVVHKYVFQNGNDCEVNIFVADITCLDLSINSNRSFFCGREVLLLFDLLFCVVISLLSQIPFHIDIYRDVKLWA